VVAFRPAWDGVNERSWEIRSDSFLQLRAPEQRLDFRGGAVRARKKCGVGYSCGSTCITVRKECLVRPGSAIGKGRLKRLLALAAGGDKAAATTAPEPAKKAVPAPGPNDWAWPGIAAAAARTERREQFLAPMTAKGKQEATAALSKMIKFSNGWKSRQEQVEELFDEGFRPGPGPDGKLRLQHRWGSFYTVRQISTIGLKYAQHLTDQLAPPPPPAAPPAPAVGLTTQEVATSKQREAFATQQLAAASVGD